MSYRPPPPPTPTPTHINLNLFYRKSTYNLLFLQKLNDSKFFSVIFFLYFLQIIVT